MKPEASRASPSVCAAGVRSMLSFARATARVCAGLVVGFTWCGLLLGAALVMLNAADERHTSVWRLSRS